MAVTKLWKVSVRLGQVLDYTTNPEKTANPEYSAEDYQALKDVLAYAKDEEKTEHEFFCDGINCNVAMARDQFITVKEQFGKTDGIQAYHGYLSFKENEVTPEQAQQIGMEFARKMWGKRFQVVVTTHLNTKHLHCHFVINSVSFADGKRLKDKEKSWYYFRHIADEICLEHKLSIVEKPELHRSPAYLTKKDEAGMPTRYNNAKKAIDEAIAMSRNLRQFQYELSVMGYHSNFSPNRKYATVTPKGSEKPIRTYRLGEEYTKEKILERLIANRDNIVFKPFQPKTYIVRQYRLPTRENKIQKVGGLYGLYLYYCYRLGYLDVQSRMDRYTANNALLMYKQFPQASQIKEFDDWAAEGVKVNKGSKTFIILDPYEYTKKDGTIGIDFNLKRVLDVSQTNGKRPAAPTANRDPRKLVAVMLDSAPINIESVSELPYPDMGAFYKNEDQTLYVKRDIGDSVALCQCVAQELGHAELSMNSEVYSRRDMGFQAVCIGYMLCKKYGVDTQNFAIDRIPDELKNKEPKDIKAELGKTQKAFKEITARVSDELYRQRAERSKEQER